MEAIRHVASGKLYLSKDVMAFLAEKIASGATSTGAFSINQLSDREFEVFRLIGQGYDTREVAESLDVNIKTVQTYCSRIKEKLGVRTGAELLREAIQWRDGTSAG